MAMGMLGDPLFMKEIEKLSTSIAMTKAAIHDAFGVMPAIKVLKSRHEVIWTEIDGNPSGSRAGTYRDKVVIREIRGDRWEITWDGARAGWLFPQRDAEHNDRNIAALIERMPLKIPGVPTTYELDWVAIRAAEDELHGLTPKTDPAWGIF